jgi:hypothetical protein
MNNRDKTARAKTPDRGSTFEGRFDPLARGLGYSSRKSGPDKSNARKFQGEKILHHPQIERGKDQGRGMSCVLASNRWNIDKKKMTMKK